jgi:hypothetical protein
MMLADRLDGVLTVLKALSVHCMMMAYGMDSAKVGTIRTSHDLLGEGQILATMAHTVQSFSCTGGWLQAVSYAQWARRINCGAPGNGCEEDW